MSWQNNPPGGPQYGGQPAGYNPQGGYSGASAPPPAFNPSYNHPGAPPPGQAPAAYAPPPGQAPAAYAPPPGQAPAGYAPTQQGAPAGYAPQGQGYRPAAPGGYAPPQSGHAPPPGGYAPPQSGHAPPPGGYAPPPGGYAPPTAGYGPPQPPPGVSQELWQWFQSVDADKSGKITSLELQRALMNGNWTPFNGETCRLMIGMFDKDRNGTIDVHEFSALWKYIQDWKSCFDRFDTDRSGNINTMELQNAFNTFGYNLSPNFCALCVRVFDRQSTTTMNFDDFIQCCVMLKALTEQFRGKDTQQSGVIRIHYEEFLKMALDNAL